MIHQLSAARVQSEMIRSTGKQPSWDLQTLHSKVEMIVEYCRTSWLNVNYIRRSVLPQHTLPHRLPLQTSQICIHHANLPSKHQQQRSNLPRHPQISVVPSSHRIKGEIIFFQIIFNLMSNIPGVTVHMLSVVWPQPRWSSSSRDRQVNTDLWLADAF